MGAPWRSQSRIVSQRMRATTKWTAQGHRNPVARAPRLAGCRAPQRPMTRPQTAARADAAGVVAAGGVVTPAAAAVAVAAAIARAAAAGEAAAAAAVIVGAAGAVAVGPLVLMTVASPATWGPCQDVVQSKLT
jgi:hypothetical protein